MGTGIIIGIVIALNLYLMGDHGGRGGDYIEQQDYSDYEPAVDVSNETPEPMAQIEAEFNAYMKSVTTPSPTPVPTK